MERTSPHDGQRSLGTDDMTGREDLHEVEMGACDKEGTREVGMQNMRRWILTVILK